MIPKSLQGNEAKPFILAAKFQRFPTFDDKPPYRVAPLAEIMAYNLEIQNFLNRDFTPDVAEFFEGWVKDECNFLYIHKDSKILNPIFINLTQFRPAPATLNDFVTACHNSDIKLIWRSE